MARLEADLSARGHQIGRWRITIPTEGTQLLTDTFDQTSGILYEIKHHTNRETVRMAIGQLIDYRRHLPQVTSCVVLLPTRPSEDLVDPIHSAGFGLAYLSTLSEN